MMLEAKTDPTATTNTKSKTFSFERVRLPETRSIVNSAANPMTESVTVRPTLYQLSKKNGGCGIAECTSRIGAMSLEHTGKRRVSIAGIAPPAVYIWDQ